MHDIRRIREDREGFDAAMNRRGAAPAGAEILALDAAWRASETELQRLRQHRNEVSRRIGRARGQGEAADAPSAEMAGLRARLREVEEEGRQQEEGLRALLAGLPNIAAAEVPVGPDEHANALIRTVGHPPVFDFAPRDHAALGAGLGLMDFPTAARLSGARFVVLRGALARLERALAAFMLDIHTREFGYTEVAPPLLVRDQALFGTGQLPKMAEDQFRTTTGHWLIPTAEVTLTNLVAGEILAEEALPLRFVAHTPCFRSEAGAAGRDTAGMIRQHQFNKVELVSIAHPDRAGEEHERMTGCAEAILQRLGLHYRVMLLSTGDMGFSARKTYDIEVWMPGQDEGAGRFREISSCSDCGDFQARRMRARFRRQAARQTGFVHTLNGSALAVGRTLIAVLENGQRADGSIAIPPVLRPYMDGRDTIPAAA